MLVRRARGHAARKDSAARNREIARRWARGEAPLAIAAVMGLSRTVVYKNMKTPESAAARKQWKADRLVEMIELYESGLTTSEVGAKLGVGQDQVRLELRKAGVWTRRGITPLLKDRTDEIVELYESGLSLAGVGAALGVHATTVLSALKRAGVPRRARSGGPVGISEAQKDEIAELYEVGFSLREIAKHLGLSSPTVLKWLRDRDVERRRRSGRTISEAQIAQMIELYLEHGMTLVEIGELFDVGGGVVRRWLHIEGVQVRSGGRDR